MCITHCSRSLFLCMYGHNHRPSTLESCKRIFLLSSIAVLCAVHLLHFTSFHIHMCICNYALFSLFHNTYMVFAVCCCLLPMSMWNMKERRIERIYYRVKMSVGLFFIFLGPYSKRFSERNHVSKRRFFREWKEKENWRTSVCPMIFERLRS